MKQTVLISLWAAGVIYGFVLLTAFDTRPGEVQAPPQQLSARIGFSPDPNLFKLVLGIHPQCACSKATVGELARIVAHADNKLRTYALVYHPENPTEEWSDSGILDSLHAIEGVQVIEDKNGKLAQEFHIMTSGEVILYDGRGHLAFWGGITAARAHAGDNTGESTILTLVNGGKSEVAQTSVYGCHLRSPETAKKAG